MCNLYTMTATVDELRRIFGPFEGERDNLPPFDEIYPGKLAPVPVLIVSVTDFEDLPGETGAVGFLSKPFSRAGLERAVRKALSAG